MRGSDSFRNNPDSTLYAYFFFQHNNGNSRFDVGENPVLVDFAGFDPDNPASLVNPNVNDPGLDPQMTDELILGVEHSLMPELVVGLQATYRLITGVHETRRLLDPSACAAGIGVSGPGGTCQVTRDE